MLIFVDVDETLCEAVEDADYSKAKPIYKAIKNVNQLYDGGNRIVIWTARGSQTGIDWTMVTERQLQTWGVKYHELRLDKPHYDLMICDKTINPKRRESWSR